MVLFATLLVAFTLTVIHQVNTNNEQLHLKEIKLRNVQLDLENLDKDYTKLQQDSSKTQSEKQKEIEDLKARQTDLEAQLQAKALLKANQAKAYAAAAPKASVSLAVYPVPANEAKAFIYAHESGNDPTRVNSIGCRGLGQACPGSKLPCDADYACQDAWFTNYALTRYGSWEAAYVFWIAHRWW